MLGRGMGAPPGALGEKSDRWVVTSPRVKANPTGLVCKLVFFFLIVIAGFWPNQKSGIPDPQNPEPEIWGMIHGCAVDRNRPLNSVMGFENVNYGQKIMAN